MGCRLCGATRTLVPAVASPTATLRGIPWLYTESRGGGWLNKPHAGLYARGLTNVLKQLGILDGEIDNEPPERHLIGDGNNDATSLPVQESGYFIPEVDILDRVKKGDPVGRVEDLAGETIDTVRATEDGTVVVLRKTPSVTARRRRLRRNRRKACLT